MIDLLLNIGLAIIIGTGLFLLVIVANLVVGMITAIRLLMATSRLSEEECGKLVKIMEEVNSSGFIFHGFILWWKTRKYLR